MSDHVLDRLSAFLDEELPAREQDAVEIHLRDCAACASHLDLLRSVDAEARDLPLDVPEGYFETLPGRIRGRLQKTPRSVVRRLPVWTWAAAAALLLGVVTPLTMRNLNAPAPTMREPAAAALPPATYPAPAAAEPAPPAGAVARSAPAIPREFEAQRNVKDDAAAASKLGHERKETLDSDLRAAASPPAPAASLEAPSKAEADREVYAYEAVDDSARADAPRSRPAPGGPSSQQQAPVQAPAAPAFAEAPVEAPAAAAPPPAPERRADANETSRDERSPLAKRRLETPRQETAGEAAAGRVSSAVASSDEKIFRLLQDAAAPTTLASWRERRESWRSFTRDFASSPRADEARVRVIEAGAEAWRLGGEAADLTRVHEDAAAYLERRDAAQSARVRVLVQSLPARP
jgi:hypothetical protein